MEENPGSSAGCRLGRRGDDENGWRLAALCAAVFWAPACRATFWQMMEDSLCEADGRRRQLSTAAGFAIAAGV